MKPLMIEPMLRDLSNSWPGSISLAIMLCVCIHICTSKLHFFFCQFWETFSQTPLETWAFHSHKLKKRLSRGPDFHSAGSIFSNADYICILANLVPRVPRLFGQQFFGLGTWNGFHCFTTEITWWKNSITPEFLPLTNCWPKNLRILGDRLHVHPSLSAVYGYSCTFRTLNSKFINYSQASLLFVGKHPNWPYCVFHHSSSFCLAFELHFAQFLHASLHYSVCLPIP